MSNSFTIIILTILLIILKQIDQSQQNLTPQRLLCTDNYIFCKFWASINECEINKKWMHRHCRLSCNVCLKNEFNLPTISKNFNDSCKDVIQTIEILTRFVPTNDEFREDAIQRTCAIPNQKNKCSRNICYHTRYRTFDGSCNNLKWAMQGSAYNAYARILSANYEDGHNRMFGATFGQRPNARDVTHFLLSTKTAILTPFNGLLMLFGQFLSHDLTRITLINTCSCTTRGPQCANIPISPFDTKLEHCIPFTRTIPICGTGPTGSIPRTQINENTAFIDGSQIYGSDPRTAQSLRSGPYITTFGQNRFVFPPVTGNNLLVGDNRANLFIGLAAMHTLFVRLHNKIVNQFLILNSHWTEERTFQETRKIVGAIIQVITYEEFIPILLGDRASTLISPYTGYKPTVNPAISVEFAGAAFRLHGMIREFYQLVNNIFQRVGNLRFVDGAGDVRQLLNIGTDFLIRGMLHVASKKPQRLTTQITEELFGSSDMGSLNIQRGRDLGLKNYNAYRKYCNLSTLKSFQNWPEVSNQDVKNRVSILYENNPDKLDLYVGGLLEEPHNNSIIGPTFSCIIAEQFVRLRDGDRFFYRNSHQFTFKQINALSKYSLSRLLCDTGENFNEVPKNSFFVTSPSNFVSCSQIPKLDLSAWKD